MLQEESPFWGFFFALQQAMIAVYPGLFSDAQQAPTQRFKPSGRALAGRAQWASTLVATTRSAPKLLIPSVWA
jgi:hypothetical protein